MALVLVVLAGGVVGLVAILSSMGKDIRALKRQLADARWESNYWHEGYIGMRSRALVGAERGVTLAEAIAANTRPEPSPEKQPSASDKRNG